VVRTIVTIFISAFILLGQSTLPVGRSAGDVDSTPMIFPPPVEAFDELKQALTLSDAQVLQLRQIMQERNDATQQIWQQVAQKQNELNELLRAGSRDLARIGQLSLDIYTLSNQPPPSNDQWRLEALAVLTPDQKLKLAPLDQAMKLNVPAYQAVSLNLIDPPPPGRPHILDIRNLPAAPAPGKSE